MTDRDLQVLEFISKYNIASTKQIQDIFFKDVAHTVAARRLRKLVEEDYIKKFSHDGNKNIFYIDKKTHKKLIEHDLLITDVIVYLINSGYVINEFKRSFCVGNIIADAYIQVIKDNKFKNILLEVQLSNHDCISKYENLREILIQETDWKHMPRLMIVGNNIKKTKIDGLNIKYYNLKMEEY